MTIRKEELQEKVRERWQAGTSYDKLGAEYQVSPRTIQRWVKGENAPRKPRQTPDDDWPESRQWPADWTLDALAAMPGLGDAPDFTRDAWQDNLALLRSAQEDGDLHTPWAFRALVDLAKDNPVPLGERKWPWAFALASLPVVGHWAGREAPFQVLSETIRRFKPWESKVARREYLRETKGTVSEIRQCLRLAQALSLRRTLRGASTVTLPVLLGALAAKLPEPDKRGFWPVASLRLPFDSIVLGILTHKPVSERG